MTPQAALTLICIALVIIAACIVVVERVGRYLKAPRQPMSRLKERTEYLLRIEAEEAAEGIE